MKWIVAFVMVAAASTGLAEVEIKGQAFTVTGLGPVKLPLVEVKLYKREAIERSIKSSRDNAEAKDAVGFFAAEASQKEGDSKFLKSRYLLTASYLIEGLPAPLASDKTDADGGFVLSVPAKGDYALVAEALRPAPNGVEVYQWIIKATAPASKVLLSPENTVSSGSAESMVSTVPPEDELKIVGAVGKDTGITGLILEARSARKQREIDRDAEVKRVSEARERDRLADLEGFHKDPSLAQKMAVKRFPALSAKDSPLNAKFVELHASKKASDPGYFAEPDWPIRLAEEAVDALVAERDGR